MGTQAMTMLTVLVLCLFGAASSTSEDEALDALLSNPQEFGKLFESFEREHHRDPAERDVRYTAFKKHAEDISLHNHEGSSWREALNDFADLTDSERTSHLGLNVSRALLTAQKREFSDVSNVPERFSWIEKEAVTEVKDQGSCGSCWAFGAIGTLEGRYAQVSGVLRHFSEQQLLDCTYPDRNGCSGGWMSDGINRIIEGAGGELAATVDYPYKAYDGTCNEAEFTNSLIGGKLDRYVEVTEGEEHTIRALSETVVTVTIHVLDSFFAYSSGIYRDNTYTSFPNHALAAVSYTPSYILVKNSWGASWGDRGFIKIARNYDGCSFHRFVGFVEMSNSGNVDHNTSDPVTDYDPNDGDDDGDDCADEWGDHCKPAYCKYGIVSDVCKKTCNRCDEDEGDCPAGTILCDDGICRHEHMC